MDGNSQVAFLLLAIVLSHSFGCNSMNDLPKPSNAEPQSTLEQPTRRVLQNELEGRWEMYSATFSTIGGSEYEFTGDKVSIVTKHAVGFDKIDYEIKTTKKTGRFELGQNGQTKTLTIELPDGKSRLLEYSLDNDELWVWPSGNKGMSSGFRKQKNSVTEH